MARIRRSTFQISTVHRGFFDGFNRPVALGGVVLIGGLVAWILLWPLAATDTLSVLKTGILTTLPGWYSYVTAAALILALCVAVVPMSGRLRLAANAVERPSFSTPSWLSMMFCSGIGGGIIAQAVAEPLSHLATNPGGAAMGDEAARAALKYTYLHWGLTAWAVFAVLGLALALCTYRYGLPLTIRSALAPLLGRRLSGPWGHSIDIFAIVAIIAAVATTMSFGVQGIAAGLAFLSGSEVHLRAELGALVLCTLFATFAVLGRVAVGVKWLSNTGTTLFFFLLVVFAIASGPELLQSLGLAAAGAYFLELPGLVLMAPTQGGAAWQTEWSVFYWTWWLAFMPFASLFVARISRGRTVREFILGVVLAPTGLCIAWFASAGSAAFGIEMVEFLPNLGARAPAEQLFATLGSLGGESYGRLFGWIALALVVLLSSTTFACGTLAITTIAAAGCNRDKPAKHVILWATVTAAIIAALLIAGGTAAVRDIMVISALPMSILLALAGVSVLLMLRVEAQRARAVRRAALLPRLPVFRTRREREVVL